ncbi:MAG: 16S rRNA (guanine(527)-N(7))-methyltransferase RsmG [Actinomycetota bacterium]
MDRIEPGAVFGGHVAAASALLRELYLPLNVLSLLLAHAAAVARDADRLGLVSERTIDAIVARHTGDSLLFALVRRPLEGEAWVDVGSGAGFPGLVLACCFPETQFTLVEPQRRRAGFLELQTAELGLLNAEVRTARAAELGTTFDVATARALAEPAIALEALKNMVNPDGTVLVAVGSTAIGPPGVQDMEVARPGVDSPGRFFMIAPTIGGA